MSWDLVIENGTIVTENEVYPGNIYVQDGKIKAITNGKLDGEAHEIVDASGKYILPGLIDTHVHSRDGGATYKEDFFHSTQAAAAGGITAIFEMPNTNPPINNVINLERQLENLTPKAHVDFGLWGICLGDLNLNHLEEINQAGVIGFKYFWGYAIHNKTFALIYNYEEGMEDVIPPADDGEVFRMFEEVAKTGKTFAIHAENSELINYLTEKMKQTGQNDYDALLASRPNLAEALTIQTGIAMAKETGARLHILHVSSAEGVDLIRQAQKEGYPITAETCPHFLFLTNEDFERVGPEMKVYPLVKYKKDQERLWEGIRDGVLTIVCSDHAPHTSEEKQGELWNVPAGMCGVETLAPLMLQAVSDKKISLQQVVSLLSTNPAKQFGVYPQKGSILVDTDADLTIVDMNREAVIQKKQLHSKSKVSAFDGVQIKGIPVQTIVRGITVMKDGEIKGEPIGKFVFAK
ncbi:allantoinase AllB [Ralstonia pickettii]|nr:allantoinase AllB [Ralstonia pickettii]